MEADFKLKPAHLDEISGHKKWSKRGFDTQVELYKRKGLFIEVAGPTKTGYKIVDFDSLPKKVYISNLYHKFTPNWDWLPEECRQTQTNQIDFRADATLLPFAPESIGAIFTSLLYTNLRFKFLDESINALEPGGLVVFQGGVDEDIEHASKIGFKTVAYIMVSLRNQHFVKVRLWDAVFQK